MPNSSVTRQQCRLHLVADTMFLWFRSSSANQCILGKVYSEIQSVKEAVQIAKIAQWSCLGGLVHMDKHNGHGRFGTGSHQIVMIDTYFSL